MQWLCKETEISPACRSQAYIEGILPESCATKTARKHLDRIQDHARPDLHEGHVGALAFSSWLFDNLLQRQNVVMFEANALDNCESKRGYPRDRSP